MGKHFDRIDIVYIVLISIYLVVLFVGILWFILTKLEKKMTKVEIQDLKNNKDIIKHQSKKLTNNIKDKVTISASKKVNNDKNIKKVNNISKKNTNVNKKAPISKNKVNVKNTNKRKNNSSNRSNGYVSPTKRKNNKKKKSSTKKRSSK